MLFFLERPFFAHRRTETILCLSVFFMLISVDGPFYDCQAFLCLSVDKWLHFMPIIVEKKNWFISKWPFFRERSVRFDFFVPPKKQMVPFRFTSLHWSLLLYFDQINYIKTHVYNYIVHYLCLNIENNTPINLNVVNFFIEAHILLLVKRIFSFLK